MKRFPCHLVASTASNVGFWTLVLRRLVWIPGRRAPKPSKWSGNSFHQKFMKRFPGHLVASDPQMWDVGLFNSFLDPQIILRKRNWSPGKLQESSKTPKMKRKCVPLKFHEKISWPTGGFWPLKCGILGYSLHSGPSNRPPEAHWDPLRLQESS